VFHRLWLGHMYMGSKGMPMHSPQSTLYGETLARCTHTVYPPRFLRTARSWGLVCSIGFGFDICTWKEKVCPCIAPKAHSTAKP
jgi:hypothetical protein